MECRICSGPADGFHYKTTSCRACSAFFGRTIKLKLQYNCRKQGKCNVSVSKSVKKRGKDKLLQKTASVAGTVGWRSVWMSGWLLVGLLYFYHNDVPIILGKWLEFIELLKNISFADCIYSKEITETDNDILLYFERKNWKSNVLSRIFMPKIARKSPVTVTFPK